MTAYPCQLSPHQRFALRSLRLGPAIHHQGRWRLKGAPAPDVTPFALSTLLGMGLVWQAAPARVELTLEGRAMLRRLPA